MAIVACPGCGLPRAEGELASRPCPLCDRVVPTPDALPLAEDVAEPDRTAGLPADVSELYSAPPVPPRAYQRPPEGGSRLMFVGVVIFLLGVFTGVGAVLGLREINGPKPPREPDELALASGPNRATAPAPRAPMLAPMPHEPAAKSASANPASDFKLPPAPGPAERTTTVEINQPDVVYTVPFLMKGERLVLKGRVKTLRVHALDGGAVLDASALEAEVITVTGNVDNHSSLKLNAPHGTVHVTGKIDNGSKVEINAPGGEVQFMLLTTAAREGSKIANGSAVAITARLVELKGDVTGPDTRVSVTLTRNAWLKITAITDHATVEYKSQAAGWSPPEVTAGTVGRNAKLSKLD